MSLKDIIEEMKTIYINDPTTQPTAFWKFNNWANLPNLNWTQNEGISSFVLGGTMICRYPYHHGYDQACDESLSELIFSHKQSLPVHWHETQYFKLYHTHEQVQHAKLPDPFEFQLVNKSQEGEVAQFINDNYEHIRVSEAQVRSWTTHDVYDKALWVWIVEKNTQKKAALGIAERDLAISEGALEWIQVDSNFRGKGLGKILVNELLNRLSQTVQFTTVSGEVDNKSNPEKLYRACGFQGDRIWYVYKKIK